MHEPLWPGGKAPKDFWKNPDHRRWYVGWLGEQLGHQTPDDWYQLTARDFQAHHGGELLAGYYRNSPALAVKSLFPKIDWHEWLFEALPDDFWTYADHRQRYMRWLGAQCGYRTADDWYQLTAHDFSCHHGEDLLRDHFRNSPLAALQECFPEHDWHIWRFPRQHSADFWADADLRRQYLTWLGAQLGYRTPEDWYRIAQADFDAHNTGDLLAEYYAGNPALALREYWPEYDWPEWCFEHLSPNFWQDWQQRRRYMLWLGAQLDYHAPDDWYRLTQSDIEAHHGRGLLQYYDRTVSLALLDLFPDYDWQPEQFACYQQRRGQLQHIVKNIFSEYDLNSNPEDAGARLGIMIAALNLAFDCQHDYQRLPRSAFQAIAKLEELRRRDDEKLAACRRQAITRIEIPGDWDGREDTALDFCAQQFVAHVNARRTWPEHIRPALTALAAYRRKQIRKQRQRLSCAQQQLSFLPVP